VTDPTSTRNQLEQINLLLQNVDHSAKSNRKYRALEGYLGQVFGIPASSIYAAYVSKAGNTRVRFDQSDRAQQARLLIALVDPPSTEPAMRSVRALERFCASKRPDAEILVLHHDRDSWRPYAVIFAASDEAPLLQSIVASYEDIRVLPQTPLLDNKGLKVRPSSIRFIAMDSRTTPRGLRYPLVVLYRDEWADDSYETLFSVYLYQDPGDRQLLGEVKILKKGQRGGRTPMPTGVVKGLGPQYCSLGQAYSYYETIRSFPESIYRAIFRGLRDVVYLEDVRAEFEDESGYAASLARTGGADRALQDAGALFSEDVARPRRGMRFNFRTNVGGNPFEIDFSFDQSPSLPDRVNAVIGYNGCGKTELLANIAMVATSDLKARESIRGRQYGHIVNSRNVRFGSVITISYSAFDTFVLPDVFWETEDDKGLAPKRLEETGEVFGYAYCGLRKPGAGQTTGAPRGLKSIDELNDEFSRTLDKVRSSKIRAVYLDEALSIVRREPSFGRIGLNLDDARGGVSWLTQFNGMSTGHKIVLNILVQIIGHSNPKSLILIDEPESHLHPSLLAALVRSLNTVLRRFDSYAIVATHSPVVLQEIPRKYVRILQRFDEKTQVVRPQSETFGENVGYLTTNVFHLDSTETDYHAVLKQLAAEKTIEEIEDLFDDEMSAQARAYVLGFMRSMRRQ
jgi:AAA15 family ATPase/GTPase